MRATPRLPASAQHTAGDGVAWARVPSSATAARTAAEAGARSGLARAALVVVRVPALARCGTAAAPGASSGRSARVRLVRAPAPGRAPPAPRPAATRILGSERTPTSSRAFPGARDRRRRRTRSSAWPSARSGRGDGGAEPIAAGGYRAVSCSTALACSRPRAAVANRLRWWSNARLGRPARRPLVGVTRGEVHSRPVRRPRAVELEAGRCTCPHAGGSGPGRSAVANARRPHRLALPGMPYSALCRRRRRSCGSGPVRTLGRAGDALRAAVVAEAVRAGERACARHLSVRLDIRTRSTFRRTFMRFVFAGTPPPPCPPCGPRLARHRRGVTRPMPPGRRRVDAVSGRPGRRQLGLPVIGAARRGRTADLGAEAARRSSRTAGWKVSCRSPPELGGSTRPFSLPGHGGSGPCAARAHRGGRVLGEACSSSSRAGCRDVFAMRGRVPETRPRRGARGARATEQLTPMWSAVADGTARAATAGADSSPSSRSPTAARLGQPLELRVRRFRGVTPSRAHTTVAGAPQGTRGGSGNGANRCPGRLRGTKTVLIGTGTALAVTRVQPAGKGR